MSVSITKKQRKKYSNIGIGLIKKKLITGFQLEDHSKSKNEKLVYAHSDKKHLNTVKKNINGKTYPRESHYLWNTRWKKSPNTTLYNEKKMAYAKEKNLDTKNTKETKQYLKEKTVKGKKESIDGSWDVPDTRISNSKKSEKDFKGAYRVTKKIDNNSRLSMLVTNKNKVDKIKKEMDGEKVDKVKVQDYKPKKHSFFSFIKS